MTTNATNASRWFRKTQRASMDLQVAHANLSNWLVTTVRAQGIAKDRPPTAMITAICTSLGLTKDQEDDLIDLMHEVESAKCSYIDVASQHPDDP